MARCSNCHQSLVPREGDICQICQAKMKHGSRVGGGQGNYGGSQGNYGGQSNYGGQNNNGGQNNYGGIKPYEPLTPQQETPNRFPGVKVKAKNEVTQPENNQVFSVSGKSGGYVTGIVQNYQVSPSDDSPLERWFKSFSTGVPYTKEPIRISFNVLDRTGLQNMNLGGVNSVNVQIYGSVSSGDIGNGQEVEVWGKMSSNRVLYANRIRNKRNGVETTINRATPAGMIRFITIAAIVLVLLLIFGLAGGLDFSGMTGGLGNALSSLFSSVIGIVKIIGMIAFFAIGSRYARRFGLDTTTWLIICAVVALLLMPELGAIFLMLAGIACLFKFLK